MAPSIKDIAALCGVSDVTVSRVLNAREDDGAIKIGSETRDRVLAVARELGYRRNRLARNLARGTSHVVGFVTSIPADPFSASLMQGVQYTCRRSEYALTLCHAHHLADDEIRRTAELLAEQSVDAILVVSSVTISEDGELAAWLADLGRPVVMIDQNVSSHCVCTDDRIGMRSAVDYLISLGHRRIGFAGWNLSSSGRSRLDGYTESLHAAGLDIDEELIVPGGSSEECGQQAVRHLVSLPDPPTAIVGVNDIVAVAVMRELRELSLDVPDDMSLIGYSDMSWTDLLGLTTVRQPAYDMGIEAAEMALRLLRQPDTPPMRKVLSTELVIRESCARHGH